jgi:hypothetical protein
MRLKVLFTAATLIASSAWAQQQPSAVPEASPSEKGAIPNKAIASDGRPEPPDPSLLLSRLSKDEPIAQDRRVDGSTPPVDPSPESIARVRAALEKPPPILTPPDTKADFSLHIEQRVPLQEIFESPPWATSGVAPGWGGGGSSTPLVSVDVLPLLQAAIRAQAERAAREEVKRAIADYCAAQPSAGAGIQICATGSGVR